MKLTTAIFAAFAAATVFAQSAGGRDAFLRQQAVSELQRVTSQIDLLQNNYDDLARRVSALERGNGESAKLQAEIDSLRSQVAELKKQLASQRGEIVKEISGKIAQMPINQPAPKAAPAASEGPYLEYTVQSGDSLYLIAKAFGTTVPKIRAKNPSLKGDQLKVGQKLKIPKE